VGGGITAQQRGGLLLRGRLPQAVQQPGHAARVVEGDVGGGPAHRADIGAEVLRRVGEVQNSAEVAIGGGDFVQLGGVTVQTARVGGVTKRGLVAGQGVICGGCPERGRGELALVAVPAVLVQVVREPVQRSARDAGRAVGQLLIVVLGAGPGGAGSGREGADAGKRTADAFAGDGRIGQGLLQPVLVLGQLIPLGAGQVPGRGCFRGSLRQRRSHAQAAGIHRRLDHAAAAGGALRYRASNSGAPARNWITCPSSAVAARASPVS